MPSNSWRKWQRARQHALDEIENAHALVGGTERGRRYATLQINYAYATLLSSQFQGFCRDLHSECVDHIITIVPSQLKGFLRSDLIWNRSLDRGNPHPGAIGVDFNRLGINLWGTVYEMDARNGRRRELLQLLVDWRNAIAHQDFDAVAARENSTLRLETVRAWRRAVAALARHFDKAMYNYLSNLLTGAPW